MWIGIGTGGADQQGGVLFGRTGQTVLMPAWYTRPSGSTPAGGCGASSCFPCGQPLEVKVGNRLCPQGKGGFASYWGILTLQFLAPHSLVLRCSTWSGRTVSGFVMSWSWGETKQGPVSRLDWGKGQKRSAHVFLAGWKRLTPHWGKRADHDKRAVLIVFV